MGLRIRIARTTEDLDRLLRARHRVFVEQDQYLQAVGDQRVQDRFDVFPTTANFIATLDGEVVGGVRFVAPSSAGTPADDFFDFSQLLAASGARPGSGSMLFVDRAVRSGLGVAQALVRAGLTWCALRGATHVLAVVNPKAERLFLRLGHEPVASAFFHARKALPVLPMVLKLEGSEHSLHDRLIAAGVDDLVDEMELVRLRPGMALDAVTIGKRRVLVVAGGVAVGGLEEGGDTGTSMWLAGGLYSFDPSNGHTGLTAGDVSELIFFPTVGAMKQPIQSAAARDDQPKAGLERAAAGDDPCGREYEPLTMRLVSTPQSTAWQPTLLRPERPDDCAALVALFGADPCLEVHDTFRSQVAELLEARKPSHTFRAGEIDQHVDEWLAGRDPRLLGTWVWLPWSRRLVHLLDEGDYLELRTNRNRYKITPEEQDRLRRVTIGVVGLSVGLASAVTLAQEGIGGHFRLADFDVLGASNLNRLRASVADLSVNKAVIAARHMYEIDPFLDITVFGEGVSEGNVEQFLLGGGPLDMLVEECDDLEMKVVLRERARAHRIPVVMETSEGGMLDIERFDLEPERPIFHGLVPGLQARTLRGLPMKEKLPYVLRILGVDRLSTRGAGSLIEVKESTSTWPQLASSVALGGALVTDAVRRVLLGELNLSGRFYVELDDLIREGKQVEVQSAIALAVSTTAEALAPASIPTAATGSGRLDLDHIRAIVSAGVMAPSGGNAQPWRYIFRDGALHGYLDRARGNAGLDYRHAACYLAHGAAVENMVLHAATMGFAASVEPLPEGPDGDLVSRIRFHPDLAVAIDPLADAIPLRVTNRRLGDRKPLESEHRARLLLEGEAHGARLLLVEEPGALCEMAELLAATDRSSFLNKVLHRAIMGEVRWSAVEVERTRDGLDAATLELSAADLAAFRVMSKWPAMQFVGHFGGGRALEQPARKAVAAASALGLLLRSGTSPDSYFLGGRAMQRVWLSAAALGLAVQPMTSLPYLFARLERGGAEEFLSTREIFALKELRERYLHVLPVPEETAELLLFRVAYAPPPAARSLRRRLDDVLKVE